MKFQPPKGTRDITGEMFYRRQWIANTILSVLETYGFRQVQTPGFEDISLLTEKSGPEIKEQIYTFTDKSGREFGLKSDITPPVARLIAASGKSTIKPIKISCADRVYRYERPQSGRYREIYQVNAELFGASPPLVDAELLACFVQCYRALGIPIKVIIGSRPILETVLLDLEVAGKNLLSVIRIIDKRKKITDEVFVSSLVSAGLPEKNLTKLKRFLDLNGPINIILPSIKKQLSTQLSLKKYVSEFNNIASLLDSFNIANNCEIDLGLARGFEYYTGIIFEAISVEQPSVGSIGGGGRYDELVSRYGNFSLPAVGFSIGLDRLDLVLQNTTTSYYPKIKYYIASSSNSDLEVFKIKLVTNLRNKGVNTETDLNNRSISDQLTFAKKISAEYVVLLEQAEDKLTQFKLINIKAGTEKIIAQLEGIPLVISTVQ